MKIDLNTHLIIECIEEIKSIGTFPQNHEGEGRYSAGGDIQ